MNSTSRGKSEKPIRIWSVVAWLLLWHGLSVYIGHEILLVSPVTVVARLLELAVTIGFWQAVMFSLWRIASGFLLACFLGTIFAAIATRFERFEEFLAPLIMLLKTTPVASFIILALIWISSKNLSVLIAFIMVMPIIYTNVLWGIKKTDTKLLEMALVFRVSSFRKIIFIYIPQVLPFFESASLVGLGLCWKAGVAAEVIAIPNGSIGEKLYMAKIYLTTPDLFAWTLTVIVVSVVFERVFMFIIRRLARRLERL